MHQHMTLRTDAKRLAQPWLRHPRQMIRLHCIALKRVFVPHDGNNNFRKLTAGTVFAVWAITTLGIVFNLAELGTLQYGAMTGIVYTILGIQWGFEISGLVPEFLDVQQTRDPNRTDSED